MKQLKPLLLSSESTAPVNHGTCAARKYQRLQLVIPVYNEAANFRRLWEAICRSIASEFEAVVVYDFDQDDTISVVTAIIRGGETRLSLLKNAYDRGVVGAIRTGFDACVTGPVLVLMADLSDDLGNVDQMLDLYCQGFDVVVGSRHMPGGRMDGGPLVKKALSRLAGISLHYLRGLPTHDATNAFKMYDAQFLRTVKIESTMGFELNLELTVKAFLDGRRMAELPSTWNDRTLGESRFRLWKWLPHYLRWYFFAFQRAANRSPPQVSRHTQAQLDQRVD